MRMCLACFSAVLCSYPFINRHDLGRQKNKSHSLRDSSARPDATAGHFVEARSFRRSRDNFNVIFQYALPPTGPSLLPRSSRFARCKACLSQISFDYISALSTVRVAARKEKGFLGRTIQFPILFTLVFENFSGIHFPIYRYLSRISSNSSSPCTKSNRLQDRTYVNSLINRWPPSTHIPCPSIGLSGKLRPKDNAYELPKVLQRLRFYHCLFLCRPCCGIFVT
ncbi:hypothetical protein BGW80DRAFT_601097 [Lactifluus volemus]|nr:hypothetical protein BGW80DRAFT_601097 [Lactifluus volemus]